MARRLRAAEEALGAKADFELVSRLRAPHTLPGEMPPRGGFILPETLVLARFLVGGAISAAGAIFCTRVSAGMKHPLGRDSFVNTRPHVACFVRVDGRAVSARSRILV